MLGYVWWVYRNCVVGLTFFQIIYEQSNKIIWNRRSIYHTKQRGWPTKVGSVDQLLGDVTWNWIISARRNHQRWSQQRDSETRWGFYCQQKIKLGKFFGMDLTWITHETTFECIYIYILNHRMVKAMNLNNSRITPNVSRMGIKWWTLHTFWGSRFQCSCLLIRIQIKCKHFEQTWTNTTHWKPSTMFFHHSRDVANSGHLVSFFIKHTMFLLQVISYVVPNNQYSSNIPYIVYTLQ